MQQCATLLSLGCSRGDDPDTTRAFGQAALVSFVKAYVAGVDRYRP